MQKNSINPHIYGETHKSLENWLIEIKNNRISLYSEIKKYLTFPSNLKIVEIGAGSAWLSALCSQNENVTHIDIIEIDSRRIKLAQNYFSKQLNANSKKLSFHNCDFHKMEFIQSESIDTVLVDAALHHTDELDKLLDEIHRILKLNGKLIAIREPILPKIPILKQYRKKTFGVEQIKEGDIENIYSKKEWINFFKNHNFEVNFYPLFGESKKDQILNFPLLRIFNGVLFNRYYIVAKRA